MKKRENKKGGGKVRNKTKRERERTYPHNTHTHTCTHTYSAIPPVHQTDITTVRSITIIMIIGLPLHLITPHSDYSKY